LATLRAVLGRDFQGTGHDRRVSGRHVVARIGSQRSDSFQEHPAVTDRTNADFLQVLLREAREDPLAYLVLAECRLVSFEAKTPQPNRDVHVGASPYAS
jgi:hypothetical protein